MFSLKNHWRHNLAQQLFGRFQRKDRRSSTALLVEQLETRAVPANMTSFEFTDLTGDFTLFNPPEEVRFLNGEAKSIGAPPLYHSGLNSFMINAGDTGIIDFDARNPAEHFSLFLKDQTPAVQSDLKAINTLGNTISLVGVVEQSTGFTEFTFTRTEGQSPIDRIEITNNAIPSPGSSTSGPYVAIDDFSFSTAATTAEPLPDPIPATIPASSIDIQLTPVATGLVAPNWGTAAPGIDGRLIVTDQPGILYSINLESGGKSVFLDVSNRLVDLGAFGAGSFDERGLLGVAFHPNFAANGLLYTYTSEPVSGPADFTFPGGSTPNHQSVVTEWRVMDPTDPDTTVDASSDRELLRIDQPQFNHNAGALNFGPDGYLYISLGDGGGADDQGNGHSVSGNGQDPTNVLGSVLRINPLGNNSANGEYGIPAGNPFVGNSSGIPEETFAFGFRNPFRFSFDSAAGELILGDVGQNDIEEVNRIDPVANAGDNFGWKLKEGTFFFDDNGNGPGFVTNVDPGVPGNLIDPVLEYDHDEGISVIGGFVYRGTAIPDLQGQYVFGDFSRSFDLSNPQGRLFLGNLGAGAIEELTPDGFSAFVLGFGQDANGELYVLANETGVPFGDTGTVYRIDPLDGGEVLARFVGDNLILSGDKKDNAVDISLSPSTGNVVVKGERGTDIRLLTRQPFTSVDNGFELTGVTEIRRNLFAFLGRGDDRLKIRDVDIGRNVHIDTGVLSSFFARDGAERVLLSGTPPSPGMPADPLNIGGHLTIFNGGGDDAIATDFVDVRANAIIRTSDGEDGVVLNNSNFGGVLHVDTGDDMDIAFLDGNSSVGRFSLFRMGQGDDVLALETNQLGRHFRLDGGRGTDALSVPVGVTGRHFEVEGIPVLRFGATDGNAIPLMFGGAEIGVLTGGLSNFAAIGKFYASPLFSRVAGPINAGGVPLPVGPVTITFSQPVSTVKFFFVDGTGFSPILGTVVLSEGTATAMLDNGDTITVNSREATFLGDASNFVTFTAPMGRTIKQIFIDGGVIDNLIVIP